MLPHADMRWIDSREGSYLHFRFVCIAVVRATGELCIHARSGDHCSRVGSVRQGKRYAERWFAHNANSLIRRVRRRSG